MRVHILGICGTFMAGVAILAKEKGYQVSGCDQNVYPPMSTLLADQGIEITSGFDVDNVPHDIDVFIIGNAMKRGVPLVEYILNRGLPYVSGPEWLSENILKNRWVLAVSGTHGKTTTSSMLAWILTFAGLEPGFLIGGVPHNFGVSARLGGESFFVIEADEYDSAFFDKRSKFVHYRPRTLILNNLEFDHADIFSNLLDIQRQFHHLIRTVPGEGQIIKPSDDQALREVINMGVWTPVVETGPEGAWQACACEADGSVFEVFYQDELQGRVAWSLIGKHNQDNALSALAAAHHAGVPVEVGINALCNFKSVKRRLENRGSFKGITVYDDFAHHPTAIETTLAGLRQKVRNERIIAVLECGSFTMRTGVHQATLSDALQNADFLFCCKPVEADWSLEEALIGLEKPHQHYDDIHAMLKDMSEIVQSGDHILVMSNTGFAGFHEKLLALLSAEQLEHAD